jgi:hypothetical protein
VRWQAAQEVTLSADAKMLPLLDKALAAETDPEIKTRLQLAHAQASLGSTDAGVRLDAVRTLGDSSDPRVRQLLIPLTEKRGDQLARTGQRSPCRGRHVHPFDRAAAGVGRQSRARLHRSLARLDPAARRSRPGDHLWRDGRHQHGARRAADGRRLFGLGHAERLPGLSAGRA